MNDNNYGFTYRLAYELAHNVAVTVTHKNKKRKYQIYISIFTIRHIHIQRRVD